MLRDVLWPQVPIRYRDRLPFPIDDLPLYQVTLRLKFSIHMQSESWR